MPFLTPTRIINLYYLYLIFLGIMFICIEGNYT
jgi:hypothetical protein